MDTLFNFFFLHFPDYFQLIAADYWPTLWTVALSQNCSDCRTHNLLLF